MKRSKLPRQAAPVERNITGTPMSSQSGVDPSFGISDIWNAIQTYAPVIAKKLL